MSASEGSSRTVIVTGAVLLLVGVAGGVSIWVSGGVRSTVQAALAGVASALPAARPVRSSPSSGTPAAAMTRACAMPWRRQAT